MCLFEVVSKKRMGNVPASPEEEHQVLESSNKQEIEEIYVFLAELKMGLEKDVARVDEDVKAGAISANLAEDLKSVKREKYNAIQAKWTSEIESLKLEIKE